MIAHKCIYNNLGEPKTIFAICIGSYKVYQKNIKKEKNENGKIGYSRLAMSIRLQ